MKFDVIVIGGGQSGFSEAMNAVRSGKNCALISEGLSINKVNYNDFTNAGGTLLMGDSAEAVSFNGDKVKYIRTHKLGDTPLEAGSFILATGRFFSKGLSADMTSARETLMGLDVDFEKDRQKWFSNDFFAAQPFMDRGVVTDSEGHPFRNGEKISNVKVVGSILSKAKR